MASVTEDADQEWNLSARFDARNVCVNRTRTTSEKSIRVLIQAFVLDTNFPIQSSIGTRTRSIRDRL